MITDRVKLYYSDGTRGRAHINNRPNVLVVTRKEDYEDVEHRFRRFGPDEYIEDESIRLKGEEGGS